MPVTDSIRLIINRLSFYTGATVTVKRCLAIIVASLHVTLARLRFISEFLVYTSFSIVRMLQ